MFQLWTTRISWFYIYGYPILMSLQITTPITNQRGITMALSEGTKKLIGIQIRLGRDTGFFKGKISAEEFYGKLACECRANGIEISQQLEDEWKYGSPQGDYLHKLTLAYYEYKEIDPDLSIEDFHKIFTGKSAVN